MLITLGFYKRKPGLTQEQFSHHWRNIHGPMIANHPVMGKYIKRYVQHHMRPGENWPNVGPLDYDGFSESWWESLESRREMHSLPEFQKDMIDDERQFLDMEATRILMFDTQHVIIGKDYTEDWMQGRL